MKKHFFLFSACLSFLFCLSGCQAQISAVDLTFGKLYDSSLDGTTALADSHVDEITHSELATLVSREENFALLVYNPTNTCTCWSDFSATIAKFIAKTNLLLYAIDESEFDGGHETYSLNVVSDEETIAIFENGSVKYQKTSSGSSDDWTTYANFSSWMKERIHFSSMLTIEKSQLNPLFESGSPFALGFLRASCSDCSYLSDNFLKAYNAGEHGRSYVINCDVPGIREDSDGSYDATRWQTFKDTYGLSAINDSDYGYLTGVVPTFFEYNPSSSNYASCPIDGDVYCNDVLTLAADGVSYTVKTSYFDGTRNSNLQYLEGAGLSTTCLVGLTVKATDVTLAADGTPEWNHSAAAKYHDAFLKAFLDFYAPAAKS